MYPSDELEWLASMTFNQAIDFYHASQTTQSRCWIDHALVFASLVRDNGALSELLQNNRDRLDWDR